LNSFVISKNTEYFFGTGSTCPSIRYVVTPRTEIRIQDLLKQKEICSLFDLLLQDLIFV